MIANGIGPYAGSGIGSDSGGSWFWVRESTTVADTDQIAAAATRAAWSYESIGRSRNALWGIEGRSGFGQLVPMLAQTVSWSPYLAELSIVESQIGVLLRCFEAQIVDLMVALKTHAEYLGVAALIYASAEADAGAYISACSSLATLGCSVPEGSYSPVSLIPAIPGYIQQMMGTTSENNWGSLGEPKLPNLSAPDAQNHISAITQPFLGAKPANQMAGGLGVAAIASSVGAWWERAENMGLGHNLGVAVTKSESPKFTVPSIVSSSKRSPLVSPKTAGDLLSRIPLTQGSDELGEIQILKHETAGQGKNSWSVVIPGTKGFLPGSTHPQDMITNLKEIGGYESDQRRGVRSAMELAGIKEGDAIEFVGHSQGGAVALALAGSPEISSKYKVVSVLTAGAPASPVGDPPPDDVQVLALENLSDVVPALDGTAASTSAGHQVIHFNPDALDSGRIDGSHSVGTYVEAANQLHIESKNDPTLQAFTQWEESRMTGLGIGESTKTEALYFSTRRVRLDLDGLVLLASGVRLS